MKNTILLVEDDDFTRFKLKKRLSEFGEVHEAQSYAVAKVLIKSENFKMAVINAFFGQDGSPNLELLELCVSAGICTIMLSDYSEKDFIETAYKIGCFDYLTKRQFESSIQNSSQFRG